MLFDTARLSAENGDDRTARAVPAPLTRTGFSEADRHDDCCR
jgi:hypothetical protein